MKKSIFQYLSTCCFILLFASSCIQKDDQESKIKAIEEENGELKVKIETLQNERLTAKKKWDEEKAGLLSKINELNTSNRGLLDQLDSYKEPERILVEANNNISNENYTKASEYLTKIVREYPCSKQAQEAKLLIEKIKTDVENEIQKIKEKEKALKAGYKGIKDKSKAEFENISIIIQGIKFNDKWIFDRYGSRWYYRQARKDSRFLVVDYTAVSEAEDPYLPYLFACYIDDSGNIKTIGTLETEFYQWSDYGCYLGNYHDFKNDFSRTNKIRFTSGIQIDQEVVKKYPIIVAAPLEPCLVRREERYKNPPVHYDSYLCQHSEINNFRLENIDKFIVFKIINRHLIK